MPAAITPGSRYDYRRHRWNDWLAAIRPWDGDALIQCAAYCARRKITSNHPLALAEAEDTGGLLEDEWARRHGAYSYYQRAV